MTAGPDESGPVFYFDDYSLFPSARGGIASEAKQSHFCVLPKGFYIGGVNLQNEILPAFALQNSSPLLLNTPKQKRAGPFGACPFIFDYSLFYFFAAFAWPLPSRACMCSWAFIHHLLWGWERAANCFQFSMAAFLSPLLSRASARP